MATIMALLWGYSLHVMGNLRSSVRWNVVRRIYAGRNPGIGYLDTRSNEVRANLRELRFRLGDGGLYYSSYRVSGRAAY
ncbi:hypothetical protein F4818DRAFT_310787 [Hypoxylon cercidicola]|nr:hypothetical protein F4818DRAFT_310787 [Hypoxylon cercidicola]